MIQTAVGTFDGNSWEDLCQAIYKRKYKTYQEMISSPGDWGIEGFSLNEGIAIQCYCPEQDYDTATLHTNQVDKITKDINKLDKYCVQIKKRMGNVKIRTWIFITPKVAKNDLHSHARKKEKEAKSFKGGLLDDDFQILIHDIEFYLEDIRLIQTIRGEELVFSDLPHSGISPVSSTTDYDKNIYRKNKVRSIRNSEYCESRHNKLNTITAKNFLIGDEIIRKIELQSPELYIALSRIINQYETEVEEVCLTWEGSPSALMDKISTQLKESLDKGKEISGVICDSDLREIVNHIVSKWLALCPLEIES